MEKRLSVCECMCVCVFVHVHAQRGVDSNKPMMEGGCVVLEREREHENDDECCCMCVCVCVCIRMCMDDVSGVRVIVIENARDDK